MIETDLVTEEQVQKDNKIRGGKISHAKWLRQEEQRAINKLPNEFRIAEKSYNPLGYHGDSYCGLYFED